MAHLIISSPPDELTRHALRSGVVIGRCPDCEIAVHDILLSRKHCRIVYTRGHWQVSDLESRNGTFVNEKPIGLRHALEDGDVVRVGRTRIIFRRGSLVEGERHSSSRRPADPFEALTGTVFAFELDDAPASAAGGVTISADDRRAPTPRPAPPVPAGYQREGVGQLVMEMLSDLHDTVVMQSPIPQNRRPAPTARATIARASNADAAERPSAGRRAASAPAAGITPAAPAVEMAMPLGTKKLSANSKTVYGMMVRPAPRGARVADLSLQALPEAVPARPHPRYNKGLVMWLASLILAFSTGVALLTYACLMR